MMLALHQYGKPVATVGYLSKVKENLKISFSVSLATFPRFNSHTQLVPVILVQSKTFPLPRKFHWTTLSGDLEQSCPIKDLHSLVLDLDTLALPLTSN